MRSLSILVVTTVGTLVARPALAATLVVDLNGVADYTDIQYAIDATTDGDTVIVKPGEYVIGDPITFSGSDIVVRGEGGPGSTTIRMAVPWDPNRASVVIFENQEGARCRLEGFTLTGGMGTTPAGLEYAACGGGVYCSEGSSPTIASCIISGNSTERAEQGFGGGVFCTAATITNCTISANFALGYSYAAGGGVHCIAATLTNCAVTGNSAKSGARSVGGGVFCGDGSSSLTNCAISGNWAASGGGVVCGDGANLTECTISGNLTSYPWWPESWQGFGGGVICWGSPTLANCRISGNWAIYGGGVYCGDGSPTLSNCTISGNHGSGVLCNASSPALTNCIVWRNDLESACGSLSHCVTDRDPLFVRPGKWVDCELPLDPLCVAYEWGPGADIGVPVAWHRWVDGDYHLQPNSPAIDAGTSEGAPATDIEGNLRPCGAGVDIGAYEHGDCWPTARYRRGDSNVDGAFDISDPAASLRYLFLGVFAPPCLDAVDTDDSGSLEITDAIYSLTYLFLGGPAPAAPFDACGIDPTLDDLDCAGFTPCGTGA